MARERSLPMVIGPTENALRALLIRTLSTTGIRTYPAWVVLNAAAGARDSGSAWQGAVVDALKVDRDVVDGVLARLADDGLIGADGSITAHGAAELAAARSAVAAATSRLVEGVSEAEQAVVRRVLDQVRERAEALLRV